MYKIYIIIFDFFSYNYIMSKENNQSNTIKEHFERNYTWTDMGYWYDHNKSVGESNFRTISPTSVNMDIYTEQKIWDSNYSNYISIKIPENLTRDSTIDEWNRWAIDFAETNNFNVIGYQTGFKLENTLFKGDDTNRYLYFGKLFNNYKSFMCDYTLIGEAVNAPSGVIINAFGGGYCNHVYYKKQQTIISRMPESPLSSELGYSFVSQGNWKDNKIKKQNIDNNKSSFIYTRNNLINNRYNTIVGPFWLDRSNNTSPQYIMNSDMTDLLYVQLPSELTLSSSMDDWNKWAFNFADIYGFDIIGYKQFTYDVNQINIITFGNNNFSKWFSKSDGLTDTFNYGAYSYNGFIYNYLKNGVATSTVSNTTFDVYTIYKKELIDKPEDKYKDYDKGFWTENTNISDKFNRTIAPMGLDLTNIKPQIIFNNTLSDYIIIQIPLNVYKASIIGLINNSVSELNEWAFRVANLYGFDTISYQAGRYIFFGVQNSKFLNYNYNYQKIGRSTSVNNNLGSDFVNHVYYKPYDNSNQIIIPSVRLIDMGCWLDDNHNDIKFDTITTNIAAKVNYVDMTRISTEQNIINTDGSNIKVYLPQQLTTNSDIRIWNTIMLEVLFNNNLQIVGYQTNKIYLGKDDPENNYKGYNYKRKGRVVNKTCAKFADSTSNHVYKLEYMNIEQEYIAPPTTTTTPFVLIADPAENTEQFSNNKSSNKSSNTILILLILFILTIIFIMYK